MANPATVVNLPPPEFIVDGSHISEHDTEVYGDDDDVLDQYHFNCEPDVRIKFKKEVGSFKFGAAVSRPWQGTPRFRLTAKPLDLDSLPGRCMQKVLILPQQSIAALYSKKMRWNILRLQFVAGYNWRLQKGMLDYRISTKWNDGARIKRKERYFIRDYFLLRCKWNVDMQLPDLEGHLGGFDDSGLPAVELDYGRMDFDITQIDIVTDLDGFGLSWYDRHMRHDRRLGPPFDSSGAVSASSEPASTAYASAKPSGNAGLTGRTHDTQTGRGGQRADSAGMPPAVSSSSSRSSDGLIPGQKVLPAETEPLTALVEQRGKDSGSGGSEPWWGDAWKAVEVLIHGFRGEEAVGSVQPPTQYLQVVEQQKPDGVAQAQLVISEQPRKKFLGLFRR